ncbi:roadblock/LC7 domain-containing protein [Streptomyces sp. NPDC020800]|uniref:roadblock/LC7 domain-containing protein n=1 Tax=Streptomyces sp. NPDC020800 TaxID=3365092 RepID=UPI0037BAFDD6
MDQDALVSEIRALKDRVDGITDSTVATVDGMLVASDIDHVSAEGFAALAAAMLGVAQRTVQELGDGVFRETVTRSDSGYVAVYAVGDQTLLAVLADPNLNLARLRLEARQAIGRLAVILSK